ncbi:MAG TPA: sulfotransferase [Rhodanobacteraceae bacterium]|nr:sulfotransferase [Rhodanobacteraceae bacterium]
MPEGRINRAAPNADRPIFIVGAGRTGSTIFHRIFSEHPHVAWQSPLCDLFPARPAINRLLLHAIDWPLIGEFLKRHCKPGERYTYWEHYCRGFAEPCRDLLRTDATMLNKRRIPAALVRLATAKRNRLLIKLTGWPRVGFLDELFPDAKFIHVYRDGRAVANSLLAVHFWRGWQGPAQWRWGELDPVHHAEWERHGRSFVALAGIQWKLLMAAMDEAAKDIDPARFMQVRYEDFIGDPVACYRKVAEFCELDWSARFEESITAVGLKTANDKWKEDLTTEQQTILQAVLAESLQRYGYSV